MSENYGEFVQDAEILEVAIEYVIAGSKANQYKYPEEWDKNIKRSVRKRADRVVMRGVEVMYKKKNSNEVGIIQSREEQMQILEMCHSYPTCCMYIHSYVRMYSEYSLIRPKLVQAFYGHVLFIYLQSHIHIHSHVHTLSDTHSQVLTFREGEPK